MTEGKTNLREGDIEDIRRSMSGSGRPIKSTIVADKNGNRVFYKIRKGNRVEITEVYKP